MSEFNPSSPDASVDARVLAEWLWLQEIISASTAKPQEHSSKPVEGVAPASKPPVDERPRVLKPTVSEHENDSGSDPGTEEEETPLSAENPQQFNVPRPQLWSNVQLGTVVTPSDRSPLKWRRALAQCSPRRSTLSSDLDVRAICADFADSGLWFEHRERHLQRTMRLLLIVDQALQMRPFSREIGWLIDAARTPGLFADVDILGADLRSKDSWKLLPLGQFRSGARKRPSIDVADVLRYPQTVICLLVTDALGDSLLDGKIAWLLRSLPPGSRAAIVHPWPREVWQRSRLGRLNPAGPGYPTRSGEQILPAVHLSPAGIASLEPWTRTGTIDDLFCVVVPPPATLRRAVARRPIPSWADRVRLLFRFLDPATMEALIAAALVPGLVDMRLLRLLSEQAGSHGGVSPHGLSLAIASGFLEPVEEDEPAATDEPVFQFSDSAARRALWDHAPPSVLRDTFHILARTLVADANSETKTQLRRLQIPGATVAWLSEEGGLKPRDAALFGEAHLPGRAVLDDLLGHFSPEDLVRLQWVAPISGTAGHDGVLLPGKELHVTPHRRRGSMTAPLARILQPALKALEKDLLERTRHPSVLAGLRAAWNQEREAAETGLGFDPWRRARVTQIAAAWVLSIVFVRTLEDRRLIDPRVAGPDARGLKAARDREGTFTQIAPFLGPRDYLLTVFRELSDLPGAREVFDARHNPVWVLSPSNEGAKTLVDFFQQVDPSTGTPFLVFPGTETRFLGDLYQDLSEAVRKRYALLQTPDFVEKFILEQTLKPAIDEFGLPEVRLIDPTCGSGHFLLGAFRDLLAGWQRREPGTPVEDLAKRALGQIYGIDINPYAVAIARFRMVLAVLDAVGIKRLDQAPELKPKVFVADSLLHREPAQRRLSEQVSIDEWANWGDGLFRLADASAVAEVLRQRYHAVVGNPPYIAEKEVAKRKKYRELYESASGKYSLAAPFTERFFELAVPAGFVGLINSNAWTKRDYGKALIEKVLPLVDVQKVIDTSGCYLPGHGTPTLLLFGRNRRPSGHDVVAVLGKRGEREIPAEPSIAPVWSEIVRHHDEIDFDGEFVSVETTPPAEISHHPWVLTGGGARRFLRTMESRFSRIERVAASIGVAVFTLEDGAYVHPREAHLRAGVAPEHTRELLEGDRIGDWQSDKSDDALFPYDSSYRPLKTEQARVFRVLWPSRTVIANNKLFGGKTKVQSGYQWFEYGRLNVGKLSTPLAIPFALVTTHFRAILDRGGRLFKHSAPIIKLDSGYDESDHQALLGYLNSSMVAFWCRLVMFPKGGDQVGEGARLSKTPWQDRLEYAGNLLQQLPVPSLEQLREKLLELVVAAEDTVRQMASIAPEKVVAQTLATSPSHAALREACDRMVTERIRLHGILISLQEEIDWRVYGMFGLPTVEAPSVAAVRVPVAANDRPFEVRLGRDIEIDISASEWFRVHKREHHADVGGPLADLYRQRLRLLDDAGRRRQLLLLETPETKRRWSPPDDIGAFRSATRAWLLERIETAFQAQSTPEIRTARQLALDIGREPAVLAAHELLTEDSGIDLVRLVAGLVDDEGVPFVAGLRYTETGMEKRATWEETWRLQRLEDRGHLPPELQRLKISAIPVPDRYTNKDFQRHYWSLRGKLDVPKERFMTVPSGTGDDDPTPVVGWAGWDHLQAAQALAAFYQRRKTDDGWTGDRLVPLLAGLAERVPWLLQWHDQPSDAYGGIKVGQFFRDFVAAEAHSLGKAVDFTKATDELRDWTLPVTEGPRSIDPEDVYAALLGWTPEVDEDAEGNEEVESPLGPTAEELRSRVAATKTQMDRVLKKLLADQRIEKLEGRPARYVAIGDDA